MSLSKKERRRLASKLRKTGQLPIYQALAYGSYGGDDSHIMTLYTGLDQRRARAEYMKATLFDGDHESVYRLELVVNTETGDKMTVTNLGSKHRGNSVVEDRTTPYEDRFEYPDEYPDDYPDQNEHELEEFAWLNAEAEAHEALFNSDVFWTIEQYHIIHGAYEQTPSEEYNEYLAERRRRFDQSLEKWIRLALDGESKVARAAHLFFLAIRHCDKLQFEHGRLQEVEDPHWLYLEQNTGVVRYTKPEYLRYEPTCVGGDEREYELVSAAERRQRHDQSSLYPF